MSEVLKLNAIKRDANGTGAARQLRREKMIPAIIYGAGKANVAIAVAENEIMKYYRKGHFISQIIEFDINGKKYKVLPKSIDLHLTTEIVTHIDFMFISDDKMQKIAMPVVYVNKNNCLGVKRGGYFNMVRRKLNILCPVEKLPRALELDVTEFGIGASIKAEEIVLPEGAKLLDDPKFVIASIIGKKGKSLEDEEEGSETEESDNKAA